MNRMIYTIDAYTCNSVYWIGIVFDNYKEMYFKFICSRRVDKYLLGGHDSALNHTVFICIYLLSFYLKIVTLFVG